VEDVTREGLYRASNPLAIDGDFCESGPIKAAACSALNALAGATDLRLAISEGDETPRRLFAAITMLERGLFGLYATLDDEPANGRVFSDLHDVPVQVKGSAPSYVEGVYRWLTKPAEFLRGVVMCNSDRIIELSAEKDSEEFQEFVSYCLATYPWPACTETAKFAERVLEEIDFTQIDPVEIATGIEMECRKLGIGMSDDKPSGTKAKRRGRKKAEHSLARDKAIGNSSTKDLIVAALNEHHQYSNGRCEDAGHAGVNKLARHLKISPSTVSGFFRTEFDGHDKYKMACGDVGNLANALKILNGELTPSILSNPLGDNDGNLADG